MPQRCGRAFRLTVSRVKREAPYSGPRNPISAHQKDRRPRERTGHRLGKNDLVELAGGVHIFQSRSVLVFHLSIASFARSLPPRPDVSVKIVRLRGRALR